jgi:hypothetical protein
MKYKYTEVIRHWHDDFPKLNNNEKIISAAIQEGRGMFPPIMILLVEKTIPFISRIRK